jgi:acyl carrier protein
MREVTLDEVAEIFGEIIDVSGIEMVSSAVLGEDIPVSSSEMLRILSRIQARYRFRLEPKEVLRLRTLGDLLETVHRRTSVTQ